MKLSTIKLALKPRYWLTALGLGFLYVINLLPYAVKIHMGAGIGKLAYLLVKRRKHIAAVNIKLCFPNLSDAERQRLLKRTFDNFGAGLIETAMAWWSSEKSIHKLSEHEGMEHLHEAVGRGKGVLLVGAHFSSLELAPKLLSSHYRFHAVFREQKNLLVNEVLRNGRSSALHSLISNRDGRKILKTIRAGEIVWFAPDHDMGERLSVYAPFFNQVAATVTITQRYAKLAGAPAIFCSHHRKPDNSGYVMRLSPLPAGFADMDETQAATVVNEVIAEHIRIDPSQYYWFHRRFKTQPSAPRAAFY